MRREVSGMLVSLALCRGEPAGESGSFYNAPDTLIVQVQTGSCHGHAFIKYRQFLGVGAEERDWEAL